VRYDDPRVRTVALQMAHVLAAANAVSRENYGISPEINELVIRGFEVGGFQAQFPRSIHGNFVSPRQVSLSLNAAFLNGSTASSVDFPDPVNAILHEYSHLYGFVPYRPWLMGAEEEGWATFSATRLSHLLYRRYGASLWVPAYDYSARADAIAQSNLSSHPAFWSHAHEFSGFQLWNHFSDQMGERNLYQQRWNLTQRKEAIWWYQLSDPRAARDFASHFPGLDSLGNFQPIPYGQIYSLQEVQTAGALLGIDPNQVTKNYEQMSRYMIDPAIRVPAPWPSRLDLVLSTFVAAAALALARWKRRTSATVDARTR
jgi:hypothetical protein